MALSKKDQHIEKMLKELEFLWENKKDFRGASAYNNLSSYLMKSFVGDRSITINIKARIKQIEGKAVVSDAPKRGMKFSKDDFKQDIKKKGSMMNPVKGVIEPPKEEYIMPEEEIQLQLIEMSDSDDKTIYDRFKGYKGLKEWVATNLKVELPDNHKAGIKKFREILKEKVEAIA